MKFRRILSIFLAVVLFAGLFLTVPAYADDDPLHVKAGAALLVDAETELILYDKNAYGKMYPASITKIMTALLVMEALDAGQLRLDQQLTVTPSSLVGMEPDGSTADLEVGEIMSVQDLLYCLLVISANETANILAEGVCGSVSAFVEKMNAKAAELGCENTHFANTSGLHDPNHYTTAWDIYLFTREAMKHELFMTICNTKAYTVPATNLSEERELHSTNSLISNWRALGYLYDREDINAYAEGIKTGTTDEAGHCLVSSAVCGSRRLISVVLNAGIGTDAEGVQWIESFTETSRLFDWGFDHFATQTVLTSDELIQEVPVALSKESDCVLVHPQQDAQALLPIDVTLEDLTRTVTLNNEVALAPIAAGDVLGQITISYNGFDYVTVPLLALSDVSASNFLTAKYMVKEFLSRTIVKIALALLVILIVLIVLWWKLVRPKRRYGRARSKQYRHRAYRGRRR